MKNEKQVIVIFCCENWPYIAADLAGSLGLQYSPRVKLIKVPCSGRVDMIHILKAFEWGADGVFIIACREGDCKFSIGNLRAKRKIAFAKEKLEEMGFSQERVGLYNISAAMGEEFVTLIAEITDKIEELGATPIVHKPWEIETAWGEDFTEINKAKR